MVVEITSAMEVVNLPSDEPIPAVSSAQHRQRDVPPAPFPALSNPADQPSRPYDFLGPPADPVSFPQARYHCGKRADVLCYNPETDKHEVVKNVLFRDYSRASISGNDDAGDSRVKEAYWKNPHKPSIKTIMGQVDICVVLERCLRQKDDDDDSFERSSSSSDGENSCVDEEDIVFQWTRRRVAVKVNYCDRMERLRNRHAEDPLKEIAAMQLIGDSHPNVLGCREVLFDGRNLNVIMRFCDSGELFQLLQEAQTHRGAAAPSPGLSEGQARYWFRQIMSGVQHLHSVGICHRDLSPENVMVDDNRIALIIDMGMCLRVPYFVDADVDEVTDIQRASQLARSGGCAPLRCLFKPQGACGKLPYMSPEIYKNRTSFDGAAADVWTAGTILFYMVTGNRSYQRPHLTDSQFCRMTSGLPQLLSDWRINLSPEGLHLLQNMLQVDPRLRLTLDEVANHPWFSLPDEPMRLRDT